MKVILHSNAPWSPSGYGQQVSLLAPRLARHADLTLSAFHGLQGAPIQWEGLDVLPSVGGTYGDESILGHAESVFGRHARRARDDPARRPRDRRAGLEGSSTSPAGCPSITTPCRRACGAFLATTAAIPVAMSRFGHEQLAGFDALYVPHGIDLTRFSSRAGARARTGLPESAFVVGAVAMNKGVPSRKSLPQIIEAFALFRQRHPEALLYLHTEETGAYNEGYDLPPLIDHPRDRRTRSSSPISTTTVSPRCRRSTWPISTRPSTS